MRRLVRIKTLQRFVMYTCFSIKQKSWGHNFHFGHAVTICMEKKVPMKQKSMSSYVLGFKSPEFCLLD